MHSIIGRSPLERLEMSLRDILSEIERLESDIYADIVVQEEESHTETVWEQPHDPDWGGYATLYQREVPVDRKVIDVPKEAVPDVPRREAARTRLQNIYESSEWYRARFAAALALRREDYYQLADGWISELARQIRDGEDHERIRAIVDLGAFRGLTGCPTHGVTEVLLHCYNGPEKTLSIESGKLLGYSRFRVLAREALTWLRRTLNV